MGSHLAKGIKFIRTKAGYKRISLGSSSNDVQIDDLYQGTISAASNPNYPAGLINQWWVVSTAGKIGGAAGVDVEVGDRIIAIVNNAGGTEAAVGTSWIISQVNIDPSTLAELYAGTSVNAYVTPKVLKDNGETRSAATILALAGGTTNQLTVTNTGTQHGIVVAGATTGNGILVSGSTASALEITGNTLSAIHINSATTNAIKIDNTVAQAQMVLSSGAKLFTGAQTTAAGIFGVVGAYDATGSIYMSTGGAFFIQVANIGAASDWQPLLTSTSSAYDLGLGLVYSTIAGTTLTLTAPQYFLSGNIGETTLVGTPTFGAGSNTGTTGLVASLAAVAALYATLKALPGTAIITPSALESDNYGAGVGVFIPGVYTTASAIGMTASKTIVLSGDGDYVFVSTGGAITFGANDNIILMNGAKASRVFFVANNAITIGANNNLKGNFLSGPTGAITVGSTVNIEGRLLSPITVTIDGTASNFYLPVA